MDTITLHDKSFQSYITEEEIRKRIKELASQITEDYKGQTPLLLPVLNGAFIFAADLMRELGIASQVQFVRLSTYGDEMSSSRKIQSSFGLNNLKAKGRHLLIIEDIIDSGFTSGFLKDYLSKQEPASLKIAAFLFKPDAYQGKEDPDYVGFEIPNKFVVGYGLDYAQMGRELKGIYQLKQ